MAFDRFLIGGPFSTGLQQNLKPWIIADDAFETLTNAYVFRGRVRKRYGSTFLGAIGGSPTITTQLSSRLANIVGMTDGSGNFSQTPVTPANANNSSAWKIGQLFSVGTQLFTVHQASGSMFASPGTGTGTFNTTTGAVVITGATPNTNVVFYPSNPVMGIANYQSGPITDQPTIAFDTQFAYRWNGSNWQVEGNLLFDGNNDNFVWTANYFGSDDNVPVLFATNFQVTNYNGAVTAGDDFIWWYDGTTWNPYIAYFAPNGGAPATGPFVQTTKIIVGFKNRLLFLNTVENDNTGSPHHNTNYTSRCRYSWVGSPFAVQAWYEPNQQDSSGNIAGGAGFVDATTEEQIISAEFIKDRLIVFFERSTWELVYTGNQVLPFVWQKINTELGSEGTFSSVPFDKVVLTMGTTGVHACNGANVERIDDKIPDEIFEIQNKNEGVSRVAGVRDYYVEQVYWTFPSSNASPAQTYPNRVLVYNYKTGSWAINYDTITAWGYFEQQPDATWQNSQLTWEYANMTWQSGVNLAQFRQIVAGNQEGFTFIIAPDVSSNAAVLQLTNMTNVSLGVQLVVVDHNLEVGQYVRVLNATGTTGITGIIYPVVAYIDANTFVIGAQYPGQPNPSFTGTYTGGGNIQRVSNIEILTKQFNPYVKGDRNVYIQRVDFGVETTAGGQLTVDYYPSYTELSMLDEANATGMIMGTGVLETSPYDTSLDPDIIPLEALQQQLWHPIYLQTQGEAIQLFIYMAPKQITDPVIPFEDFQMHGMVLFTQATTARLE